MTSSSPAGGATWNVQAQNQTTRLGPNNSPVQGYDITFVTGAGHIGTVFVTMAQYQNTDTVKGLIAAAANLVDTNGSLSSSS